MILYVCISSQGWIIGLVIYTLFTYFMAFVLQNFANLEMMKGADEMFFLDDDRNCLNIVAFHKWDKITDVDSYRKTMLRRACQFPRLKSKVVKVLGKYMLNPYSDQEMMDSMDKTMPIVTDVHDERQLADFMAKEQSTRLPLGFLQWRLFLIPDYRPNESLFVYKVHHSLADGIANILFFNHLTDEPKLSNYPNIIVRLGFFQDLFIKMCMPFYLIWLTIKLVFIMKSERNGYKTDEVCGKLKALKNFEFIPDLNIEDVKKKAAELSSTG